MTKKTDGKPPRSPNNSSSNKKTYCPTNDSDSIPFSKREIEYEKTFNKKVYKYSNKNGTYAENVDQSRRKSLSNKIG